MKLFRVLPALSLAIPLAAAALPALAQDYDRPPRGYEDPSTGDSDYPITPRSSQPDAGSVAIRMSKAENRIREMTGQIEELQNANRRLVEQLQKFQADVDSRLSAAPPRKRAEAPAIHISIGRIDMGPNFSLVEVPAAHLAGIVDAMRGLQVDGREVVVRPDRRPPARR